MSVLNRIRSTLEGLLGGDEEMQGVYYGACSEKELQNWNYFVFGRLKTTKDKGTRAGDYQTYYEVNVVHEDYIPEGYVEKVIAALEAEDKERPGTKLKASADDVAYNYTFKGRTNTVVEIATIVIYHPEKRC